MSAGVQRTFNLPSTSNLTVSFKAALRQSSRYERDEFSSLFASLDGEFLGSNANNALASITGNGNGGAIRSTGYRTYRFELEAVPAGRHVLVIGGFNNKKTESSESTEILVDDVLVETRANQLTAVNDDTDWKFGWITRSTRLSDQLILGQPPRAVWLKRSAALLSCVLLTLGNLVTEVAS